jgi:rfaE bifunctional protein nucleotidyltransferase chain/domain
VNYLNQIKNKLFKLDALAAQCEVWRSENKRVVFTNGVFDLLHVGHITYLAEAAEKGDKFIIGLNSDASVKTLSKGPARPIKDEDQRAFILAALQFIDAVVIFSDSTPLNLIQTLRPAVLVKGGDYDPQETDIRNPRYIVGSDVVKQLNGDVDVISFVPGYSTSSLEQKILEANS